MQQELVVSGEFPGIGAIVFHVPLDVGVNVVVPIEFDAGHRQIVPSEIVSGDVGILGKDPGHHARGSQDEVCETMHSITSGRQRLLRLSLSRKEG